MIKGLDRFENIGEAEDYLVEKGICKNRTQANSLIKVQLPKESYYQHKIMECIQKTYPDAFIWKATAAAYSRKGIPDVCVVLDGIFYGIEVKRPYFGVVSAIQKKTMEQIREAGGVSGVACFPEEAIRLIEGGGKNGQDHVQQQE
jgi:hypothetical protein